MFQVFTKENVNEVLHKKPLICFYSSNGACGPSGLMLVIFSDKSSYGYSTYSENTDHQLVVSIASNVPEFGPLLHLEDDYEEKRGRQLEDMSFYYLGLGNACFIHDSLIKEDEKMNIKAFKKLIEKVANISMDEMFNKIWEETNGHK